MESTTLTVHWHDENQPVYAVDFQRSADERLVTAGGDNNVRIWRLHSEGTDSSSGPAVEYLSTLAKHTQAVNVARFDPTGSTLATAGDDGTLILWRKSDTIVKEFGQEEDEDIKESWTVQHVCRSSTSEIYDIAWSPDLQYIAAGSMDNYARIYRVSDGSQVHAIGEHSHYVQGVAWDPLGAFLATQLADRSVHIHALTTLQPFSHKVVQKVNRADIPVQRNGSLDESPAFRLAQLYHSETLQSFFRRLTFSPDGSLLVTPLGIYRESENRTSTAATDDKKDQKDDAETSIETNTVYVFTRAGLNRGPICHLPGLKKPAIAVKFCPQLFKLKGSHAAIDLPYRMIFAVATQDSIVLYDTQRLEPLGLASNLHYLTITDLCWSSDGRRLVVSSADGFCSLVSFKDLGEVYEKEEVKEVNNEEKNEEVKGTIEKKEGTGI